MRDASPTAAVSYSTTMVMPATCSLKPQRYMVSGVDDRPTAVTYPAASACFSMTFLRAMAAIVRTISALFLSSNNAKVRC